jgi:hypothetical protein
MNSAASPWSSAQFWLAVPAILSVLLFGAVALTAVVRARPEDVPRVLAIFGGMFGRHGPARAARPVADRAHNGSLNDEDGRDS